MKTLLLALTLLTLLAATRAAEATPAARLSQFKLGAYITGPQATLAEAKGKAVLIDVWGIHCPPCLASLPEIEKIARHYKDRMLVFGAHGQDGTDDEIKAVVKKNKLTYTIINGVSSPIEFSGLPRVFIFDPAGALVFTGSPDDAEFERALRKATQGAGAPAGTKPGGLNALKKPGA